MPVPEDAGAVTHAGQGVLPRAAQSNTAVPRVSPGAATVRRCSVAASSAATVERPTPPQPDSTGTTSRRSGANKTAPPAGVSAAADPDPGTVVGAVPAWCLPSGLGTQALQPVQELGHDRIRARMQFGLAVPVPGTHLQIRDHAVQAFLVALRGDAADLDLHEPLVVGSAEQALLGGPLRPEGVAAGQAARGQ